MPESPVRKEIVIVDDHPVMRKGLALFINQEDDLVVIGGAANAHEARDTLAVSQPDLVIVDIELGQGTNGIELIKELRNHYPDLSMLVLSMHDEALYAERALRAGAQGFVMKHEEHATVLRAIRAVLQGQVFVSDQITSNILQHLHQDAHQTASPTETLSDRELEVLQWLGQGNQTRHIAEILNLSPKTVESYKARLKKKLALADMAALTRYAIEWIRSNDL